MNEYRVHPTLVSPHLNELYPQSSYIKISHILRFHVDMNIWRALFIPLQGMMYTGVWWSHCLNEVSHSHRLCWDRQSLEGDVKVMGASGLCRWCKVECCAGPSGR